MDDLLAIQQLLAALVSHTDARRWDDLEAIFAPELQIDYSALTGNPPAMQTPQELVGGWRGFLPGFTATQHLLGLPLVTVAGDGATAEIAFTATHTIADPALAGRDTWTLGGRYLVAFARAAGRWQIAGITLVKSWETGNSELASEAGRRA